MKSFTLLPALLSVAAFTGLTQAQTFSLDDNPGAAAFGLASFGPAGFGFGAEDPFGLFLPATAGGLVGPSPSLVFSAFGLFDGELFAPGMVPDVVPPNGFAVNALSADHEGINWDPILIKFSVDRATTGLPGTSLAIESMFSQAPGDIYTSTRAFPHPGTFVGSLTGAPFSGVLPSAGGGGGNVLTYDESFFGLTAGLGAGVTLPAGVPAPPIFPGTHDNLDAYNDLPAPTLDVTGDMINDFDYFFSISPDEAAITGTSSADIFDVATGAGATAPIPYAPSFTMGLDVFGGFATDDIDALVLWDNGAPLGPNWNGPGGEPLIDFAIFSLANGSMSLAAIQAMGLPVDGSTVFFTDFTGSFAVYAFGSDLGILDMMMTGDHFQGNLDALEIIFVPAPGSIAILALSSLALMHRRRR